MMKKSYAAFVACMLLILPVFSGCAESVAEIEAAVTVAVLHDTEFGAVNMDISIEDFNALGFQYGDSCDVVYSNGFTLEDIPYYNGYYGKINAPMLCGYPGYPYVCIAFCSGDSMWELSGCAEGDTVTVTLNTPGKYLLNQETMNMVYRDDREFYPDDVTFANFRALTGGNLAPNAFFRGASPVDNLHNRASTVDSLLRENGIRFILDLADTEEKIAGYRAADDFQSDYALQLIENGHAALVGLSAGYRGDAYKTKLADGLRTMLTQEGPYYIHCTEGKDRTGFVCLLLEALSGASYEELKADYMITYDNYYGINEESDPDRYRAIVELRLNDMLLLLSDTENEDELPLIVSYAEGAARYLFEGGMTNKEIQLLRQFLTNGSSN